MIDAPVVSALDGKTFLKSSNTLAATTDGAERVLRHGLHVAKLSVAPSSPDLG